MFSLYKNKSSFQADCEEAEEEAGNTKQFPHIGDVAVVAMTSLVLVVPAARLIARVSGMAKAYRSFTQKRPLASSIATTGSCFAFGDILCQNLENRSADKRVDFVRTAKMVKPAHMHARTYTLSTLSTHTKHTH